EKVQRQCAALLADGTAADDADPPVLVVIDGPGERDADARPSADESVHEHLARRDVGTDVVRAAIRDPHRARDRTEIGIELEPIGVRDLDRKSTRLNSSHVKISYAVF